MNVSLKPEHKTIELPKTQKLEDKVSELEAKVAAMAEMFYRLRKSKCSVEDRPKVAVNKEGIPLNSHYIGTVRGIELPYVLHVNNEGKYFIGSEEFSSLSAAAEAVSGVRRSGWTFWHDFTGKSLKELYR